MASFNSKYLQFTKQTGTGTQTITGVGFTGKALLLWSTLQTASGATTAAEFSLGMTDGILQSVRYIRHPGAEAATTSAQSERTNRIAWKTTATSGATPTVEVEGAFVAFTADGFTISWTTNDGVAAIYHALVLGGDISAVFKHVKINVNAVNSIAVTGVGYRPTSFIVMGGASDEFGTGDVNLGAPFGSVHGFGFSNASENVCGWTLGRGTAGAADCYRGQHTDRVSSVRVANLSGAGELMGARITSADADGFTITRDTGTTIHQPVQHVLCLKGVRFALGSFTAPLAIGAYALTLPFAPQALILQSLGTTASANADHMGLAMGAWHSATAFGAAASGGTWIGGVDAANPSVYRRSTYTDLVLETRDASSGSAGLQAAVTATSDTGATVTFSAVTGTADAILYMALAPTAEIRGSAVFGVKTTVVATRAIAFGLDNATHTHNEAGKLKVYGDFEVTGISTIPGIGNVAGPVSSTDNAIARFDSTTGKILQNSTPTIPDDGRISNVTDPSSAQDAATKNYVDGIAANLGKRQRVRAATTANVTISTALNTGDTLDGVTLATGDLVLVKNQSTAAENGVYVVGVSPSRFAEFDTYDEHPGSLIAVEEGTTNADTIWLCTSNVGGTLNTTAIAFSAFIAGGGSGNATSTGADGSEPGSPATGDLYLPNNGFYVKRYSGSAWAPWGPVFPMTPPVDGDFAWVNQGGASVDTTNGGIYLLGPATSGDSIRARVKTAPSTPYTITAAILPARPNINFIAVGMCFRQSSDGKIVTFAYVHNTSSQTTHSLNPQSFTNATTFSANYATSMGWTHAGVLWLQISDDGSNRICRVSQDGQHWLQVHSVGRTDFLTADQVGFYVNAVQATWPVGMTLLSWRQT